MVLQNTYLVAGTDFERADHLCRSGSMLPWLVITSDRRLACVWSASAGTLLPTMRLASSLSLETAKAPLESARRAPFGGADGDGPASCRSRVCVPRASVPDPQ